MGFGQLPIFVFRPFYHPLLLNPFSFKSQHGFLMCRKLGSGPYRNVRNTAPLPNRNLLYETALGNNSGKLKKGSKNDEAIFVFHSNFEILWIKREELVGGLFRKNNDSQKYSKFWTQVSLWPNLFQILNSLTYSTFKQNVYMTPSKLPVHIFSCSHPQDRVLMWSKKIIDVKKPLPFSRI